MTAPAATPDDFLAAKKPHTVIVPVDLGDDTVEFTFVAIGRVPYRDLLADHPATPEQQREAREEQKKAGTPPHKVERLAFNPDTFPAALLAETCTSHTWDADGWQRVLDSDRLNEAEAQSLIGGALAAQTRRKVIDPEA